VTSFLQGAVHKVHMQSGKGSTKAYESILGWGREGFLPMRIRRLYAGVKKMTLPLYAKRATGMKIKVLHLKNNYLFINIY
jgi:hypothetical protein